MQKLILGRLALVSLEKKFVLQNNLTKKIFALSISVMNELISGEVPFAEMQPETVAAKVAFEGLQPRPPSHTPSLLSDLIRKW